ncbi:MAG: SPW repeat protein [Candidatus Daviesbacteria bacterium]|nr:SPW repeat protein [Candidatus Daviesbacteria bacterium]
MHWFTGLLGFVSIITPYLLNYSDNPSALWTSFIFGAVLIVASTLAGFAKGKDTWEYWIVGIAGIGTILAPFVLNFTTVTAAVWTLMIIGGITVILAGIKLFQGEPRTRLGY